ncbi:MAG TPA: calcium-binding protein [Solirubrobacterales bacterium]|nr:calcium-binding protein [Solirubrobacterales bacterium]
MSVRGWAAAGAMAVLGSVLAVQAIAASPTEPEQVRCHGRVAKIVGTDGDDMLRGTPGRDVIWGGLGNDTILGGLGNDLICGGPGADFIHGGRGNDLLDGGAGDGDRVVGDLGDDKVLGGPGARDEVAGGLGIDYVNGGSGDEDLVRGDYGWDRMDGGPGKDDIASFATAVAGRKGSGVWVSLRAHKARGDGRDRLFRFGSIQGSAFADTLIGNPKVNLLDGGAGDDRLLGGGGIDALEGAQGHDRCKGGPVRHSCGPEQAPDASAYVEIDRVPGGGGGLAFVGGDGSDVLSVVYDEARGLFGVFASAGIVLGEGCISYKGDPKGAICDPEGPARWLMADLGPGNDRLRVEGSLASVGSVRIGGGRGNDRIEGGPEDDLIESGPGADRIYGGAGADGLIGGLPGPTFLDGGANGDLLAAGGGCAGGALVGGPGRDNASFAETQAHPGLLYISLAAGAAWIDAIRGCHKVGLARSIENIEGSFDNDVLIGDAGANMMLGQPGEDRFYGRGGEDIIDARDGVRDEAIQCGRGHASGRAITDPFDPPPVNCRYRTTGRPVPGLHSDG